MIRGGYFGDVRVGDRRGDGHAYTYSAPDLTRAPRVPGNNGRIPARSSVHGGEGRIPTDELAGRYDVASGTTMQVALRW